MSERVRFRRSELARAALAMRDAGVDSYDVTFDPDGRPVIHVRPGLTISGANDSEQSLRDELNAWDAKQGDAA